MMPYDDEPAEAAALLEELELLRMKLDAISRTNESLASEKAEWMEERKALVARIHYLTALLSGQLSGQLSAKAQPELLKLPVDAGVTAEEAEDKQEKRERAERERLQRAAIKHAKKGKGADGKTKPINGGGRKPVNPQLPLLEIPVLVPAALRSLPDGTPLVTLRWERSEQEHYAPAGVVRLVHLIEIMGLSDTHEVIARAPIPARIVPRCKYSDAMIVEMMVRKYMRGMPFYRVLHDMRAMGSDLSDSTVMLRSTF